MALAPGPIVGIALGGSAGLAGLIVSAVWVAHKWKYGDARAPQNVDQERAVAKEDATLVLPHETPFAQVASTTCASYVPAHAAYEPLPAPAELTHPALRTQDSIIPLQLRTTIATRSPTKLGKSGIRRHSASRGFAMHSLKASHLSAIIESPAMSTKSSRSRSKSRDKRGASRTSHKSPSRRSKSRKEKKKYAKRGSVDFVPNASPNPFTECTSELKPEPLFRGMRLPSFRQSVLTEGNFGMLTDRRSISEPSFLSPVQEDPFYSQSSLSPLQSTTRSRSTSLLKQDSGMAPTAPVPPLPKEASYLSLTGFTEARPLSPLSMCSVDTCSSAILRVDDNTPQLTAREDFSQRNRDLSLIPKLRQLEPNHVRDELVFGSRPASRQDNVQDNTTRDTPDNASKERQYLSVTAATSVTHGSETNSGRTSRLSSRSTSQDRRQKQSDAAVGTPTKIKSKGRRNQTKKTSATGSPVERREKQAAVLKSISGNAAPVRETSGTSTQSSSSLEGTRRLSQHKLAAFDEEASRPSIIKGSPESRGKRHKRSETVRIQFEPILHGPPSRSTSSHLLGDIIEDSTSGSQDPVTSVGVTVTTRPLTPFDKQGLAHSDSAPSLVASSPTLSPRACRRMSRKMQARAHRESAQSPQGRSVRNSATSSMLMKTFPETPGKGDRKVLCESVIDSEVPSVGRQFSEPEFVPPGLMLAKLTGVSLPASSPDLAHEAQLLSPSPPRASEEEANETCHQGGALGAQADINICQPKQPLPQRVRPVPRFLPPSNKASPTTGISRVSSTSPPCPVRLAPLSSSVNPLNTKPDLPPPYCSSPPITLTSCSPEPQLIPHGHPRCSPNRTILSGIREIRRSQFSSTSDERPLSSDSIEDIQEEPETPSQGQLRWMQMRDSSPSLPERETCNRSPGPLLSLTPATYQGSIFGGAGTPSRHTVTNVTNKRFRGGGVWDSAVFSWDEGAIDTGHGGEVYS